MNAAKELPTRALLPAALLFLLFLPAPGRAGHYVPLQEPNGHCYDCHTLDPNEAEADTDYVNSTSRTLPWMKIFNGGIPPEKFGCTYCHNNPANEGMREVLSHFGAKASKHPVGHNFISGQDSNNEYFSSWSSETPDELDCVDCHDVSLGGGEGYPNHGLPPETNPFMLRKVSAPDQYDGLCRHCHGKNAPSIKGGHDVRVASHGDGTESSPIEESDGTAIKAADRDGDGISDSGLTDLCTSCHDTHFSINQRLFNDGHEGDAVIVGSDCTGHCHYAGDSDGSYDTVGHGREQSTYTYFKGAVNDGPRARQITMKLACTACHVTLDPRTKPHSETPSSGSAQEQYKARYNLNVNLQEWDKGSLFGNPIVGVCYQCHASHETHRGDRAAAVVGCLDCHDEHAEGAGGTNVFMVPRTAKPPGTYAAIAQKKEGTEAVTYRSPALRPAGPGGLDFFRTDDTGFCDSTECHGPPRYAPLSRWMKGKTHRGGEQAPGADCTACHTHNGTRAGGWRAED